MNKTILLSETHAAYINLFSAKLRSFLALLGILVGTASVVAMVSGGELATNEALKQFKELGTDLLAIAINEQSSDDTTPKKSAHLNLAQAENIANVDRGIQAVAPYTQLFSPVKYNGKDVNATVIGVTQDFAAVVHLSVFKGRNISNLDKNAMFCVLGNHLYETMKKVSYVDPLGQQIQVGDNFFTVVGVAAPWQENSFVYANLDDSVLISLPASLAISQSAEINNIILRLNPDANINAINAKITQQMAYQLPEKKLYFRSAKELIASMQKQSQILTVFLGLIASISLLVGGIGVMNIMLVSIIERKREIGIRLAVGAKPRDIRILFLIEAVMLSLIGGVVGVILGLLIAYALALFWQWEFVLFWWPPIIGFCVSVMVGIFFGFYPAHKASQLDPIVALKSE